MTLMAGAAVALALLGPLVFESPPPGLAKARPALLAFAGVSLLLLVLEWRVGHRRSLMIASEPAACPAS
jgi:hypothetical protein